MELTSTAILKKPAVKERITFGNHQNLFFSEVKKQVKKYFEEKGIESTGNTNLYAKALFFTLTYIGSYAVLMLLTPSIWVSLALCAYMGASAAALGFNVMHDGSHGSFSSKKWLNTLTAHYINLLGGDAMLWKNKHNIIHHTFTNIEGFDQDIAQMPVLRLNSFQKKFWFHKYQHIYCLPVYGISSILWMFALDFQKYFTRKVGNIRIPKITVKETFSFLGDQSHICFCASYNSCTDMGMAGNTCRLLCLSFCFGYYYLNCFSACSRGRRHQIS